MAEIVRLRREHASGFRELVVSTLGEFGFAEDERIDGDLTAPAESYDAVWVVLDSRSVRGSAAVRFVESGTVELKRMYLAPQLRGRGLGRALLAEALAWARSHGARKVVLDTTDGMTAAQRLYEAAGFRRVGERWEEGVRERRHEFLYELDLRVATDQRLGRSVPTASRRSPRA